MSTNKPGQKFDAAKLPVGRGFVNYFARAMQAVAAISRYGAKKYAVPYEDKNWERLDDARLRYGDGRQRHIVDEVVDGLYDPESGLLHAAHAAWNAMAYLELLLKEGVPIAKPTEAPPEMTATEGELRNRGTFLDKGPVKTNPRVITDDTVIPARLIEKAMSVPSFVEHSEIQPRESGETHYCAKTKSTRPGYSVECEGCKTAIFGPRTL